MVTALQETSASELHAKRILGTLLFDQPEWFDQAVFGTGLEAGDFPIPSISAPVWRR